MIAKINRRAPKPMMLQWMQAGEIAPINCTGFTCVQNADESTIPFVFVVNSVAALTGEFRIEAPALAQVAMLEPTTNYTLAIDLVNAVGEPVEAMTMTVAVE